MTRRSFSIQITEHEHISREVLENFIYRVSVKVKGGEEFGSEITTPMSSVIGIDTMRSFARRNCMDAILTMFEKEERK